MALHGVGKSESVFVGEVREGVFSEREVARENIFVRDGVKGLPEKYGSNQKPVLVAWYCDPETSPICPIPRPLPLPPREPRPEPRHPCWCGPCSPLPKPKPEPVPLPWEPPEPCGPRGRCMPPREPDPCECEIPGDCPCTVP